MGKLAEASIGVGWVPGAARLWRIRLERDRGLRAGGGVRTEQSRDGSL